MIFFLFLTISKNGDLISQANLLQLAQPPLQLLFYDVQVNFFEHFVQLLTRAIFRAVFTCVFRFAVLSVLHNIEIWLHVVCRTVAFTPAYYL